MKCKNMNMRQPRQAGTHAGEGENADEVGKLVETLALASVGGSTQKVYWSKWQSWCRMRAIEGKSPWLAEKDGIDAGKIVDKFHGPTMLCSKTKVKRSEDI